MGTQKPGALRVGLMRTDFVCCPSIVNTAYGHAVTALKRAFEELKEGDKVLGAIVLAGICCVACMLGSAAGDIYPSQSIQYRVSMLMMPVFLSACLGCYSTGIVLRWRLHMCHRLGQYLYTDKIGAHTFIHSTFLLLSSEVVMQPSFVWCSLGGSLAYYY